MKHLPSTLLWIAGGLLLGGAGFLAYRQFAGAGDPAPTPPDKADHMRPEIISNHTIGAPVGDPTKVVPGIAPQGYQVPTP